MINVVSTFKDRFNQALEIRNILPADLSRKTKISESTISQYRSGYAKPKEEKLAILSNALAVNPTWLMGLDVPMELTPTIIDYESRDMEKALLLYQQYKKSIPQVQSAVDALLKPTQSDS